MKEITLLVRKRDAALFQFIIEGYEGLATATTILKRDCLVKLFVMPGHESETDVILKEIRKELPIDEISHL